MRKNYRGLGAVASLAAAVAIAGVVPGSAAAAFPTTDDSTCENSTTSAYSLIGGGASFARVAQLSWGAAIVAQDTSAQTNNGFGAAFTSPLCSAYAIGGAASVQYAPLGSGAGRAAFGATGTANQRHTGAVVTHYGRPVDFGGADEAPRAGELTNANAGDTSTAADDATLHTIPVAQSSIAIDVQLPDGCTVANGSGANQRRIQDTRAENAFAGDAAVDTWGELFGTAAVSGTSGGVDCDNVLFNRVVRLDSSGTTFQFKRFLERTNGGRGWSALANVDWTNRATRLLAGARNGAGAQLTALSGLTTTSGGVGGGIAYADLATSRVRGFNWSGASDQSFWAYVNGYRSTTYYSPASGVTGDTSATPTGANCATAAYADSRTGTLPANTTASWFDVDATTSSLTFPICALTYALAWEDAVPVNAGIAGTANDITVERARANIDRLWYIVQDTATGRCGQDQLAGSDYQALPAAVRSRAQAGVRAMTWNGASATQTYVTC